MEHVHAADHAAAHALPKRLGIDPGFYTQRESFGNRLGNRAVDHLMDELADAARSQRSCIQNLITKCVENRFDALEDVFVATHYDFVDAPRGARLSRGHGRIKYKCAFGTKRRFKLTDQRWRICR